MGYYSHRKRENHFQSSTVNGKNKLALAWLKWMEKVVKQMYVRTKLTKGGERVFIVNGRRCFADGFSIQDGEGKGTVYLFHECQIHSCPKCLGEEKFQTQDQSLKKIPHRQNYAETKGYEQLYLQHPSVKEVLVIWECDFKKRNKRKLSIANVCLIARNRTTSD